MSDPNGENWTVWSQHVLAELKRLDSDMKSINENVLKVRIEVAQLKIKSGMWGSIGALIVLIPPMILYIVTK